MTISELRKSPLLYFVKESLLCTTSRWSIKRDLEVYFCCHCYLEWCEGEREESTCMFKDGLKIGILNIEIGCLSLHKICLNIFAPGDVLLEWTFSGSPK